MRFENDMKIIKLYITKKKLITNECWPDNLVKILKTKNMFSHKGNIHISI